MKTIDPAARILRQEDHRANVTRYPDKHYYLQEIQKYFFRNEQLLRQTCTFSNLFTLNTYSGKLFFKSKQLSLQTCYIPYVWRQNLHMSRVKFPQFYIPSLLPGRPTPCGGGSLFSDILQQCAPERELKRWYRLSQF